MKFSEFIIKEAIVPELKSSACEGVIRELVESLAESKAIAKGDVDTICKAILDRERLGSTGFGKGVAVPHAKNALIKKRVGTIGRSANGGNFAALDQAPVFSVVLLLSPADSPDGHLQAMENIFRHLQQDNFRRFLRRAATQKEISDLLEEADQAGICR